MDAFYQTYKNKLATEFVIDSFFNNGGEKIYLISDHGENFSYLINKYPSKIIYHHYNENIHTAQWNKDKCLKALDRIKIACENLNGKYIMKLEDDVWLRGNINTIVPKKEIIGPRLHHHNNHIDKECVEFIEKFGKKSGKWIAFGGCGGTIFNREIFLDEYNFFVPLIDKHFDELIPITHTKIQYADFCLTFCFNISGYEYDENPDYTEDTYDDDWETNGKMIVHHYKKYYANQ